MELAPRHKFLRNVAASDIVKFRVSEMAFSGVFKRYSPPPRMPCCFVRIRAETGNNAVEKTVEMSPFQRFTDLNQFKYAFKVNQNWEKMLYNFLQGHRTRM